MPPLAATTLRSAFIMRRNACIPRQPSACAWLFPCLGTVFRHAPTLALENARCRSRQAPRRST
eukprot:5288641-Lingulodinium_polyedra.AAC.1